MNTLLDPAFLRELEALRRRLTVKTASGRAGEHLSRRKGSSAEFADHRPYEWGDDPRRIDWLAFARTGEPVVKQFRADEDVIVRLVLDRSGSIDGDKLTMALRVTAALGYMGLAASERVQLLTFADAASAPVRPLRGRAGLAGLLRSLDLVQPAGRTNLSTAIEAATARGRPGMLVVVSDFLDPAGFEKPLAKACSSGHDVVMVQILSREEWQPSFTGDLILEDAETGDLVTLTADVDTVEAYLSRLHTLIDALRAFARAHRATYVRVLTDEPVERAVRRIVERRVDT